MNAMAKPKQVTGEIMPGRVPKIANAELREVIIEAIKNNMPWQAAAQLVGVTPAAICQWKQYGRFAEAKKLQGERLNPNEKAYLEFLEGIRKAESEAMQRSLVIIQKAAPTRWQAAAWLLERKWPELFALHRVLEVSGPDGGPIEVSHVDLSKLSTEELNVMRALMAKAGKKELGHNGSNGKGNGNA